jgi:multiple sugar transport system ATP-binding protein
MTLADRVVVMNHGEIQQVGSPLEIYDQPQNTFVAGFIGSPPMNLIPGQIKDGNFVCEMNSCIRTNGPEGPVVLGFRAEDAVIVSRGGQLGGAVFAIELLGDATLITLKIGGSLVCVKMPKNFRSKIGQMLRLSLNLDACHLFEINSGERIESY